MGADGRTAHDFFSKLMGGKKKTMGEQWAPYQKYELCPKKLYQKTMGI